MRVWLEVLKANMPVEPEGQQAVKMLDSEIDRLDRAVKTFLDFTHAGGNRSRGIRFAGAAQRVLETARPTIAKAGVVLATQIPERFPRVRMDRRLIHQAVLNLLLNACDGMRPGGQLTVSSRRHGRFAALPSPTRAKASAPKIARKSFQLFFTTRPGGTGIGLANTFRFVQLHNGSIEFESEPGRGTTFRLELPLARSLEAPQGKHRDFGRPFAEEKI